MKSRRHVKAARARWGYRPSKRHSCVRMATSSAMKIRELAKTRGKPVSYILGEAVRSFLESEKFC